MLIGTSVALENNPQTRQALCVLGTLVNPGRRLKIRGSIAAFLWDGVLGF